MRPTLRLVRGLAATLVLVAALPAAAQDRVPMTFVDALEMPGVQDPQLSPDGRQVLFVIERADWKANRRVGHVYRIDVDGTDLVQLTYGERGESSPRWSPDGRTIAFLARREGDQAEQIYLLEADGGEARRLTAHPTAPGSLSWSSTGAAIWFVAADAPTPAEREKTRLRDDTYAFEETNFAQRHLWRTDLEGRTTRVTEGDFSVMSYSLGPGDRQIAMVRQPSPLLEFLRDAEVWVANADGTGATQLTDNRIAESGPTISPDGSTVLFVADANAAWEPYYNDKVFVVPVAGGAARLVTPSAPFQVERARWAADGRSIFITANHGVREEIMRVDPATGRATALTSGDHSLAGWSYVPGAAMHVFTMNTADRPTEIYTLPADGGAEPHRVTAVFDETLARFRIARQERITWKGQDGQEVEGLLSYPADRVEGQRLPLIVYTHGGPAASDKFGVAGDVQVYTGRGFAVLKPNYRGSTGYGDAFLRDMVKGYFKQAHLDVLAGADAVIARGLADPDKLVKMGWSAGGHMTTQVITFTTRFKAASSGAGAANWISMYAQSDHREFRTPWFGGTPWQPDAPIDLYWDHSPLKDVARVTTPTIFLVGEQDPRVPMPQSVEMYRALKSNGVPTHLYVAPREGHGWQELRHRLFKYQIEMEWFEKWLFDREYTWEVPPGDGQPAPGRPQE
ncbi:MAG: prolyl oligopeptidase family serine peptidase [Vicinamibacterales bacterium]